MAFPLIAAGVKKFVAFRLARSSASGAGGAGGGGLQFDLEMQNDVQLPKVDPSVVADALLAAGWIVAERAAADAPRDTGALADSVSVEMVDASTVAITFDAPYAVPVHERFDPWFTRALDESHDEIMSMLADKLRF